MLGEFSRKHQTNRSLDLAGRKSGLLVVSGELSSLRGNALEDIVDERVHDRHSLLRDTSVGVDLLQHLVNVRGVSLSSLLGLSATTGLFGRRSLLGGLASLLGRSLGHLDDTVNVLLETSKVEFCERSRGEGIQQLDRARILSVCLRPLGVNSALRCSSYKMNEVSVGVRSFFSARLYVPVCSRFDFRKDGSQNKLRQSNRSHLVDRQSLYQTNKQKSSCLVRG